MAFGAELTDARRYATIAQNGKGKKIRRGKKRLSRLLFLPESIIQKA